MNFEGGMGGTYILHRTFFVYYLKKTEKVQKQELKSNSTSF